MYKVLLGVSWDMAFDVFVTFIYFCYPVVIENP